MGLGKTIQVIATLIAERANSAVILPTLLVARTSVLGNWGKEIEKFAPHLSVKIHHGSDRIQELAAFKTATSECDVVITSYTLVRKYSKLLQAVDWYRIVIDEAQNIKNPAVEDRATIELLESVNRKMCSFTSL